MRVLVCGGRGYADRDNFTRQVDRICIDRGWITPKDECGNWLPTITVIHGGCPTGADSLADEYAVVNWLQFEEFKADWKKHGRAAGPIRNQRMIDEGKPDLVVAFPGGRGTADMVKRAKAAGVEVIELE